MATEVGYPLYPPASGGPLLPVDTLSFTLSGATVYRQVVTFGDGLGGSNFATIKGASAAPVATDPALVVALSPNSPSIGVSGDAQAGSSLQASGAMLWNGVTFDRWREVPSADGQSATGIGAVHLMAWNGGTFDRVGGEMYGGANFIHVDPSNAGTDGVTFNSTNIPQLGAIGVKGTDGNFHAVRGDASGNIGIFLAATATTQQAAIVPAATSVAASSLVLKGSAGNLLSLMASSTVSGWLMLFDATSAPADGVVTPKWAYPIAAGGALNMGWPNPLAFSTGIVAVFSTTGPFTKTASATAFISGQAQ